MLDNQKDMVYSLCLDVACNVLFIFMREDQEELPNYGWNHLIICFFLNFNSI